MLAKIKNKKPFLPLMLNSYSGISRTAVTLVIIMFCILYNSLSLFLCFFSQNNSPECQETATAAICYENTKMRFLCNIIVPLELA